MSTKDLQIADSFIKLTPEEFLHENYILYSYYTIQNRALTKLDGLKPVQRRILYYMYKANITHNKPHVKTQRVAGNITGMYHPHGDTSVSAAMARLAQTYSMRIPLIDPFGSVGSWTGDTPAAPRYWEARLTKEAELLVDDVFLGSVEIEPNFDDTEQEPVILPVKWPNAIINGTEGIAVGYASKMFSHNPTEVMDACIAKAKNRNMTLKTLMKYIKGPDLPTGGEVIGTDGIESYLDTGAGSLIIRGKYKINPLSRGRNEILFYELPYQISVEKVIAAINKAKESNQLKEIAEAKDLSDMNTGLVFSIIVKSGGNVNKTIEDLFRLTPLESTLSVNNTVLINNSPKQVGMTDLIEDFLVHREDCILNKSKFKLLKIEKDSHRLDGLLKVLVDIDKAISIIRSSRTVDTARNNLKREFSVDETQANVILGMQLRRLTKADSLEIEKEKKELEAEKDYLNSIINDEAVLKKELIKELNETKKIIQDDRRTTIVDATIEELKEEKKEKSKLSKELSKDIPVNLFVYHDSSLQIMLDDSSKEPVKEIIPVSSKATLVGVTKNGDSVEILASGISSQTKDVTHKENIGFSKTEFEDNDKGLLVCTNQGNITIVRGGIKAGINLVQMGDKEEVIYTKWLTEDDVKTGSVIMVTEDGKVIRFSVSDVKGFFGGSGTVKGMNTDSKVIFSAFSKNDLDAILKVSNKDGKVKTTDLKEISVQGRGGKGVKLITLKAKDKGPSEGALIEKEFASKEQKPTARAKGWG